MTAIQIDAHPSGFFVLRTPLLPFDVQVAWGEGLRAPQVWEDAEQLATAVAEDRDLLRQRLAELIELPHVREALFVASPVLDRGIEAWREDPESKKGKRAEETLVRYLLRMTSRATPFGLFSGCSIGQLVLEDSGGEAVDVLRLDGVDRYVRHTRLDADYLWALSEALGRDPRLRRRLSYVPNSSLYRVGERFRYAEARVDGRGRSYDLVAVDADAYVQAALQRARGGADFETLTQVLLAVDPEAQIPREEAEAFLEELIDSQLLVPPLEPAVTGREPLFDLVDHLDTLQAEDGEDTEDVDAVVTTRAGLQRVADELRALDQGGVGAQPRAYKAIAKHLQPLPTPAELPRLFQVDMLKPLAEGTLGPAVVDELRRGVEVLYQLADPGIEDNLYTFRNDFLERYGPDQLVPLVEVLDEELGIGFDSVGGRSASPLLAGLDLPAPMNADNKIRWSARSELMLDLVDRAVRRGASSVELERRDLDAIGNESRALPDAFVLNAKIAAASAEAVSAGDFRVLLENYNGPSGARLLGRFCHADPRLTELVRAHLREEEALQPDALFAEIVHLPMGRVGNILFRPLLRDAEIPFLGRSALPEEAQIPVTDLHLTVRLGRIELYSQRLGRRIVPRLTTAHNFRFRALGIYKFLCALQFQGVIESRWHWGPAAGFSFLPRVTHGKLVLALAQWRLRAGELRKLQHDDAATRFRALRELRQRRGLPRWVQILDDDNKLALDLDNSLAVDSLLALGRKHPELRLAELLPAADELWAHGPEGCYLQELLVPFVRRRPPEAERPETPAESPQALSKLLARPSLRRDYPPASEWLFVKIYSGAATVDQVLTEVVRPVVHQALHSGAADHWFFLRYGDPGWHLRLRLHGPPQRLLSEVLPHLQTALAPLLDCGLVSAVRLDTYQRELERYGGDGGMELCERIFHADSEAVLALVSMLQGEAGLDARWRLAVRGTYQLLSDFGFEGEERRELLAELQRRWDNEYQVGRPFKQQLAQRLRKERRSLLSLLRARADAETGSPHPLAPAINVLDQRSRQLAPLAAELRRRYEAGQLLNPLGEIVLSQVHMFNNRILRSSGRSHELVIYDFLHQLDRSLAARD